MEIALLLFIIVFGCVVIGVLVWALFLLGTFQTTTRLQLIDP
jgi:hypothetical protein